MSQGRLSKPAGLVLFLLLAAAFLAMNRDAYSGYFQDDELDNLSWTRFAPATEYLKGVLTPRFFENNFRPVGHFYFHAAEAAFGLNFPGYVAIIHALHLLNVWLVWLLARRLGAPLLASGAACVFFAFHMALLDALWKPMYVFDVCCALFCLLAVLFYAAERWMLSFVCFWLAYKSKEMAVMLPIVLACYELWFGPRRWRRLALFFAVSLSFGLQGLILNPNRDNEYTFRFTPAALAQTSRFYAARIFLVPYAGFLLPIIALVSRRRRTWFGLAMAAAFFFPLLWLPGRMFPAYCYLPFTGVAIAFSGLFDGWQPLPLALCAVLWLPQDIHMLRLQRRETLARDRDVREWVNTLQSFAATWPSSAAFVYSGAPVGFHPWGVEGAVKYVYKRFDLAVPALGAPDAPARAAVLQWDEARRRLTILMPQ